jgi:tetratricopeptide (TPR) repeat protein
MLGMLLATLYLMSPSGVTAQQSDDPQLRRGIDAYLLGDLAGAEAALDAVPADAEREDRAIAFLYRGMIAFAREDQTAARGAFGRALDELPSLRPDPDIHSPARLALFEQVRAGRVTAWRRQATLAEEAGDTPEAIARWTAVLAADPDSPDARDSVARLAGVAPTPVRSEDPPPSTVVPARPARSRSAGAAAGLGLLIPGAGEFYVGRPGRGLAVLAGAGAAVTAGFLITRVEVNCRSVPVGGQCPPEDVLSEDETRPYLTAGLIAAGALAVLGAIDAAMGADRSTGTRLGSRVRAGPNGDVRVTLLEWHR